MMSIKASLQTFMLHRQLPTDKASQAFNDDSLHPLRHPSKITILTPYLTQIQKRKKQRSHLQRSKKNVHQSSSRSFRIKDKSVTSLQKQLLSRKEAIKKKPTPSHHIGLRPERQRRTQSVNRTNEFEFYRTVEGKEMPTSNNFFNELYSKVKSRVQNNPKEKKPLRKGHFESLQNQRARSQQAGELGMYKISCTNAAITQGSRSQQQPLDQHRKQTKKNNFRRNKYEAVSQQTERKETNMSTNINRDMDRLADCQNKAFIKVRNKELHGSIQKSTQKYFSFQSYRPIRSKNQIELYVSTVPNPALHKASNSTNEQSDCRNQLVSLQPVTSNPLHEYDFDFKNQEQDVKDSEPEWDPSQASVFSMKEQDQFQKQKKKVELEFFSKGSPQLEWSEEDCKLDDDI